MRDVRQMVRDEARGVGIEIEGARNADLDLTKEPNIPKKRNDLEWAHERADGYQIGLKEIARQSFGAEQAKIEPSRGADAPIVVRRIIPVIAHNRSIPDCRMFQPTHAKIEIILRMLEAYVIDPPKIRIRAGPIFFSELALWANANVSVKSKSPWPQGKLRCGVDEIIRVAIDERSSRAQRKALVGIRGRGGHMHPIQQGLGGSKTRGK